MEESIKKVWAKMKEHKKASIIGAAVIVVLLIVIAVNNSSDGFYTIDVAQNYKLECSGDNGYAEPYASITTGEDNLIKDILFKLYPNSSNDYIKWDKYQKFIDNINFTYNKKDHISNGNEITATANYDKNEAKELKVKLTDTTLKTKATDLSSYVYRETNISETLQKNIDQKATEAISKYMDTDLLEVWQGMGGASFAEKNDIQLVGEPKIQSKYKLSCKDNQSSNRCQFTYIYELNLTGPTDTVWIHWDRPSYVTGQLTGYIAITVSDVKIENDNVLDYNYSSNTFKNLDEAKQKVLDAEKYDIVAL